MGAPHKALPSLPSCDGHGQTLALHFMVLHKGSVGSHHFCCCWSCTGAGWKGSRLPVQRQVENQIFLHLLFAPPAAPVENSGVCAEGKPLTHPLHRQQGHPAVLSHQRASVVRRKEELEGCVGSRCV